MYSSSRAKNFKHLALVLALCAAIALHGAAFAARGSKERPTPTSAIYIAMLYEKLISDRTPDFADWVKESPEYKKAELYERPDLVEKGKEDLKTTYGLLSTAEPIVLEVKMKLSGYSPVGKGFLIQYFSDTTYYRYTYMGNRYALVPNGVTAFQWLKAPKSFTDDIMEATDNGRDARLLLTLIPQTADPKPMVLDGKPTHLMMAEVSKMELWSKDGTRVIWDDKMNTPTSTRSKLMNLYQ
jgi:hypothetical protein